MINKISNLKLILGLVVLGLIYLVVVYFDSSKSDELDKELVSIDTAKVSAVTIVSSGETVQLYKESTGWKVQLTGGKTVPALNNKVNTLLTNLMDIQADRLAAKEESKWVDYGVDSTGVVIKVIEGDQESLDLVVGQSGSTSYLRLAGETKVYASDNFKGLRDQDRINNYRNNTFVRMETDSISSISFDYPADSSFQLIHDNGRWIIGEETADSTKVTEYLRSLKLKFNSDFSAQDGSSLGTQAAQITILSQGQDPVLITAYHDAADSVVYQSNLNPESLFKDPTLGKDFFIGKDQLLIQP